MMIDLHSHVLHEVDDGSDSLEMSIEMLRLASDTGIRAVVATPHILDGFQPDYEESVTGKFRELCQTVLDYKIDIDVYLGSEIHFQFGIENIIESSIGSYRGFGKYSLIETPLTHFPNQFEDVLSRILAKGKKPIFAHPERVNPLIGNVTLIERLADNGVLIQVNSGSVLGRFGSKVYNFAISLLDQGLVHFIASDAHSSHQRTFNLVRAWNVINELYGEDFAQKLFYTNPLHVLFSEQVERVMKPET